MKTTYQFLKKLESNNNREWFTEHKDQYEASHHEIITLADQLIENMNQRDHIENVSGKKSVFRIYRDVRFSKDKTPYKTHWGLFLKRATEALRGGYYLHIEPKNTVVAGGFWSPNKDDLLHIRKQIAQDAAPLRKVLNSKKFKGFFGELQGEQLKTAPKGFDKEHPDVDLLRYKQLYITHKFDDKEVLDPNFHQTVSNAWLEMRPFFNYMSDILTTDLNGESII
ncbi:MAG: DUF2461 domain-containing protein [Cyclobacteriaceae bacterium]